SGIVYCLSRKAAEDMTARINSLGFKAVCYHAGMGSLERSAAQRAFINGDVQVVCATVAFGMGIDKSNIRYVVHNNLPSNIESYYQEIGRAGRDGLPAHALLFYSMADMITLRNFAEESGRSNVSSEKLQQMLRFAQAGVCRRRILLNYFSEPSDHDCGNCDICLNPPHRFDGTTLAQMALSASIRVGGKAGMYMLNDILRGSLKSDIRRMGFDKIKTFGAGRDLNVAQWNHYLSQMVQLGLFEIAYDESNHLRPTRLGLDVVYGRAKVEMAQYVAESAKDSKKRKESRATVPPQALDPETQLFEQLKKIRMAISQQEGIAAYMVFSDATLQDMARKRPKSVEEMALVSGVGERKLVRFGNRFIMAIRKFEGLAATMPQGSSIRHTLILYNSGIPVPEIAKERNLAESTVYSHIAKLIDEDMITQFGAMLSRRQYEDILKIRREHPDDFSDHMPENLKPLQSVAWAIYNYQQRHAKV
ncbi:MAG: RecQ family ATP-dependent DNA helicase, partial [Muribaculaceae bacterium]|nr:RecQ family ATP-dependent DNA helicase [Muribaculaceae bacterium]